jgi:DHA2 family multidrug resistance protein-like MFS transporter
MFGGAILELFWWGAVFLVSVPVAVLLLAVGPKLLPEFRDPSAGRLDLISAALSLVAVLAVIYGVKGFAQDGLGSTHALFVAAGLALGIVFMRRQRTLADPLIDARLFRAPAFSASLAANVLGILVILGIDFFIAQYLQLVLGMGPLEAGLWLLPSAGGFILGSTLMAPLARRVRPAFVVSGGLALAAVGSAVLAGVEGTSGLPLLVIGSVLMAIGIAQALTLSTDLIVSAAPPERAGAASALSETGTELGGALGIAILGSIGTAVYRSDVAGAVPDGVAPEAEHAARDTLGGAVGVSDQLPASLIEAANHAFAHGFQVAALTSAVLMVGMAVAAALLLPDRSAEPEPEPALAPA